MMLIRVDTLTRMGVLTIVCDSLSCIPGVGVFPRKFKPLTLLLALVTDKYELLGTSHSFMTDLLQVTYGFGHVST